jgi:hypothetical protein
LWETNKYVVPVEEDLAFTFVLVSRETRKIQINKESLVLVAVCDSKSGNELPVNYFAEKYNWNTVKQFPDLKTLPEILTHANELNPTIQRGFMVSDNSKLRMKVESPVYKSIVEFTNDELDLVLNRNRMIEILRHIPSCSTFESFSLPKVDSQAFSSPKFS